MQAASSRPRRPARGDELMDVFYARLFAAAPAVRPVFDGADLDRQKTTLLSTLVFLLPQEAP